jgi:SAM-dependent methyltransferase
MLFSVRDYEHGVPGEWPIAECQDCGCCYRMPIPSDEEIPSYYPPSYTAYSGGAPTDWMFRLVYWPDAKRIERLIGRAGRVLDVGCGSGRAALAMLALKSRGQWDLWGVEIAADAAAKARENGLNVQTGELLSCNLPRGSFDLIRMGHVIEHVTDPSATLRRAFELLKPGGVLFGETINTACWDCRLFGRFWGGWHGPRHLVLFTPENLTATLSRAGYSGISLKPRLRPVGWGAGMQNLLVAKRGLQVPPHGRVPWYVILVCPSVIMTFLQSLASWPATIAFVARKADGHLNAAAKSA